MFETISRSYRPLYNHSWFWRSGNVCPSRPYVPSRLTDETNFARFNLVSSQRVLPVAMIPAIVAQPGKQSALQGFRVSLVNLQAMRSAFNMLVTNLPKYIRRKVDIIQITSPVLRSPQSSRRIFDWKYVYFYVTEWPGTNFVFISRKLYPLAVFSRQSSISSSLGQFYFTYRAIVQNLNGMATISAWRLADSNKPTDLKDWPFGSPSSRWTLVYGRRCLLCSLRYL